jgi:DUF4097 and DUF4098 domain-containing protein YvlB
MKSVSKALIVTPIVLELSGCVIHVGGGHSSDSGGGVSSLFGDVSVSAGKSVNDVSSVNGDVELEDNVIARTVDTVNGDVEIGDHVVVRSISVVNGDIEVDEHGRINGDVSNVNGDISLVATHVTLDVVTNNGDISLTRSSHIAGDLVYRDSNGSKRNWGTPPTLTIDADSTVDGQIILERPVNLNIENPALLEKVQHRFGE